MDRQQQLRKGRTGIASHLPATTSSSSSSTLNELAPADYRARLEKAVATPINIAVVTGVFWSFEGKTDHCYIEGLPISCNFHTAPSEAVINTADVLYYHIPAFSGSPRDKAFPTQLRLGMR
jgi:hypothetical protein